MTKHIVYIAMSLDGKIARIDGAVDWLESFNTENDHGYQEFVDSVDAIVMGAHTYEKILQLGTWPYMDKPSFVLTHGTHEKFPSAPVEFCSGAPIDVIMKLRNRGIHVLWVMGGGDVISSMLRDRYIDELRVCIAPVLLGKGIPLFQDPGEHQLELYSTKTHPSGIVELSFLLPKG